ncbi:MAG: hypothetical protein ACFFE6_08210 [Candidatus Thorarchaeota archaeon]
MTVSSDSDSRPSSSWGGMGRWIAVGSELPCAVIALLLAGQIVGQSVWGPSGAMWGALIGALVGFFFGVYSVYLSIGYFDRLDTQSTRPTKYMPPMEEILEDVTFDLDSTDTESNEVE